MAQAQFWNCPKCNKLNLGAWCPCGYKAGEKGEK